MNYRHHYHAGNYADVFKHVLLLVLVRALQKKEKGFLYLDTHSGRGGYDLSTTTTLPDGRQRAPEYQEGVGRFWGDEVRLPEPVRDYLALVRDFNAKQGGGAAELGFYPGSPWLAHALLRPQDRAAFCELREDDAEALAQTFQFSPNVSVHPMDGYTALRAMLPPKEKRALVLIDPPFETSREFADILDGLKEALRRFPSAVFAVWYPITERAKIERFEQAFLELNPPPTFAAELQIAGESAAVRMKGCGLLVINPPWQSEAAIRELLPVFSARLRQDAGASVRLHWLVSER